MVSDRVEAAPSDGEVRRYQMFINGRWADDPSGSALESTNPYNGRVWAIAPEAQEESVDRAVRAARAALEDGPWGRLSGIERARLMRRLADLIDKNADKLASIETTDNGKLIREMSGQLKQLPEWYYYYAGAADKLRGEQIPVDRDSMLVYTRREPVGVVAAIVPWNSPLMVLTYKLAPALAAGCTVVAKPAEQTPASTLEFAKLFNEAGFPDGVFNVVTGAGPSTGHALASHPGVDMVAFTGSTETGSRIMSAAAGRVARVTLELGGKSPNIVFADADASVTSGVVAGIFAATGQTCVAGSRLLVEASIHDEIVARLVERAQAIKLGNPLDADTEMGPIAFREQLEKVQRYVALRKRRGQRWSKAAGVQRPLRSEMGTSSSPRSLRASATKWLSLRTRSSGRCFR